MLLARKRKMQYKKMLVMLGLTLCVIGLVACSSGKSTKTINPEIATSISSSESNIKEITDIKDIEWEETEDTDEAIGTESDNATEGAMQP